MPILAPTPAAPPSAMPSHTARWDDLCLLDDSHRSPAHALDLADGWHARWGLDVALPDGVRRVPVDDVRAGLFDLARPARRFTWRTTQRHRPGLAYMQSLGRQVGFESLEEQRLLLALDFDGGARDVLTQPFALRYLHQRQWRTHVPDYLVRGGGPPTVVNVRPAARIEDDDRRSFAAVEAVCDRLGWRHEVAAGWTQPAMSVVDTLSAHRRPLADPLGVADQLRALLADRGPQPLGTLAAATTCDAIARAFVCALLWHGEATVDLARPLGDRSVVAATGPA